MGDANLNWVTPTLATGGDLSMLPDKAELQIEDILDQGVQVILDTRQEWSDHDVWKHFEDVTYVHLPTDDRVGHTIPPELFYAAWDAVNPMRNGEKVFVHCHMGVNRGPSVAFYLLLELGFDPKDAFRLIRNARPQAAVYYAPDALDAYLRLRNPHPAVRRRKVREFKEWMDAELAPFISEIQHVIRQGHVTDRTEQQILQGRG